VGRAEQVAGGVRPRRRPRSGDRLAELLADDGAVVTRCVKPTYARPAPVDLRHEIAARCEVVIKAPAD